MWLTKLFMKIKQMKYYILLVQLAIVVCTVIIIIPKNNSDKQWNLEDKLEPSDTEEIHFSLGLNSRILIDVKDSTIPISLVQKLEKIVLEEDIDEALNKMQVVDVSLSKEKIEELIAKNTYIKVFYEEYLANSYNGLWENITWFYVDMDNDGIKDIVVSVYYGGTGHSVYNYLFQGLKEGGFAKASGLSDVGIAGKYVIEDNQEYYFINKEYNQDSLQGDGICVYKGMNGKWVETLFITKETENYTISKTIMDKTYEDLALACEEIGKEYRNREDEGVIIGSGEIERTKEEVELSLNISIDEYYGNYFESDLDNDGVNELYNKEEWCPSSFSSPKCVTYSFYRPVNEYEDIDTIFGITNKVKDILQMFWVEEVNNENILCCIYCNSLSNEDVTMIAYRLKDGVSQQVFEINYESNQVINKSASRIEKYRYN